MNPSRSDALADCLLLLAGSRYQEVTRDALLDGLPLTEGYLTPALFARAAERVGMSSRLTGDLPVQLNPSLFPVILVLKDRRACLLKAIEGDCARVAFPELGETDTELSLEMLNAQYGGVAIYCRQRFQTDERAWPAAGPADGHWFWRIIDEGRPVYRDVLVAALFINLFALAMPLFVMNVYDRVVPNHAAETLWVLAIGVAIVLCADLALRMARSWFIDLVAARSDVRLSALIMERILGMRMASWPKSAGAFASSVQSFEAVRSFIGSLTVTALIDLPFFFLFLLVILLISWVLVIPVLIVAVLIVFYALAVQARLRELSDETSRASSQRNAGLVEALSQPETIKSFNATGRVQAVWESATLYLSRHTTRSRALSSTVTSGAAWLSQIGSVGIMLAGVYLVFNGDLTQGGLIAAYMLSSRALAPVAQTAALLTQYHSAATALKTLEGVVNSPQERPARQQWISRPVLRGDIEFRGVTFRYPDESRDALTRVSFRLAAGEHVGILGRVGSGKSTLARLLLGLYQPDAGEILVDGVNLAQIDPAELRRNTGYIPQDVRLLHGSVRDNITLGSGPLSGEHLLQVVQAAGLGSLVGHHADGLGMPVGEGGGRLSGGQRQSVAVARALAGGGNILLFDEPTSAMDGPLEAHVKAALAVHAGQRTLLLVTHRPALLELVDRLIVLDAGHVVADGPRQEVLQALSEGRIRVPT